MVYKYFLPFCRLLFHLIGCCLFWAELPPLGFTFAAHTFEVTSKLSCQGQRLAFLPGLLGFRSYMSIFNPFQADFVWCTVRAWFHASACGHSIFLALPVKKKPVPSPGLSQLLDT